MRSLKFAPQADAKVWGSRARSFWAASWHSMAAWCITAKERSFWLWTLGQDRGGCGETRKSVGEVWEAAERSKVRIPWWPEDASHLLMWLSLANTKACLNDSSRVRFQTQNFWASSKHALLSVHGPSGGFSCHGEQDCALASSGFETDASARNKKSKLWEEWARMSKVCECAWYIVHDDAY